MLEAVFVKDDDIDSTIKFAEKTSNIIHPNIENTLIGFYRRNVVRIRVNFS